jgi:hypothetical protein
MCALIAAERAVPLDPSGENAHAVVRRVYRAIDMNEPGRQPCK